MQDNRVWFNSYAPGVPHGINPGEYTSIVDVFQRSVSHYGARPAFTNLGATLTYSELGALSQRFAAYLTEELGLQRGERVAIMLPNCLQYPVALFGAWLAGMVVVNVNPLYTPRELRHQITDAGASVLLVLDNFGKTVEDAGVAPTLKRVITTGLGDMLGFPWNGVVNLVTRHVKKLVPPYRLPQALRLRRALALGAGHPLRACNVGPEDIALLQYTGGTTGVSKGAVLMHRNLVANLQQVAAWFGGQVQHGQEVVVTALPLYHIFALTANCLVFLLFGGHNLLITNPRDLPALVKEMAKVPFTRLTGVNTLFNGLLNTPGFAALDFSRLLVTIGAGMAVQRPVAERWKAVTGAPLIEAYGMTETSPVATINPVLADAQHNGSVGLPVPSTDVCVKSEGGAMLPHGAVGELCIKRPQVMQGYWQRPDETEKVMDADGWLHTGDLARIDAGGYVYIVDRIKDMILVSGFNVYPNEIEDVLAAMPEILEVAVIGVPSKRSGEMVKAIVVKKCPALTERQVLDYARRHLTGYKMPQIVEFRAELPKSNVGKILRRELRQVERQASGGR